MQNYTGNFRNKNGDLDRYAMACGYVQRIEQGQLRLDLWREGACYHVRAHEFGDTGRGRLFWESFNKLTDARRFYRRQRAVLFN